MKKLGEGEKLGGGEKKLGWRARSKIQGVTGSPTSLLCRVMGRNCLHFPLHSFIIDYN